MGFCLHVMEKGGGSWISVCVTCSCDLGVLAGSWVAISGVISLLIWVITIVTLLISLLITTPEPPSWDIGSGRGCAKARPTREPSLGT